MRNSLLAGVALLAFTVSAQKKNETSAAVEYKGQYLSAMKAQDYAAAEKALMNAKEYIDLAAEHPDTKESSKTHYYRGEIYLGLANLAATKNPAEANSESVQKNLDMAVASFSKSRALDSKYQRDVQDAVERARYFFDQAANKSYQEENFGLAGYLYNYQAQFAESAGIVDTNALFYAGICYEKAEEYGKAAKQYEKAANYNFKGATSYSLAAGAYRKAGNVAKAKEVIAAGRQKYPSDRDLLLELVNINIDANDPAGAEAALQSAIQTDPNNKQLYYTIGTIYIEMGQNEKAEQALRKALEMDKDYVDAQYQLGAHLVSWAGDLKTKATQLKFGDAQYDVLMAQSQEIYKRAIDPLEAYIAKNPKDKDVLNILFQLHRNLGNNEKASEFKKRADAL